MEQSIAVSASTIAAASTDSSASSGALYFPFSAVSTPSEQQPTATPDDGGDYTLHFGIVGLIILAIVGWKMLSR